MSSCVENWKAKAIIKSEQVSIKIMSFSIESICESSNYLNNLQQVIQSHPNQTAKKFGLSVIHLLKSDYDETIDYLKSLIKEFPNVSLFYRRIGEVYIVRKDYKKAISYFEKAIEVNSEDLTSVTWLSLSYFAAGECEKGLAKLKTLEDHVTILCVEDSNWL